MFSRRDRIPAAARSTDTVTHDFRQPDTGDAKLATPFHVLIATYGRAELLGRTLQSLSECRRPASLGWVLVVENGSDGGARQICAAMADKLPVRYSHLPNPGKAVALQHTIDSLGDAFILFTDDDVRFDPEALVLHERAAIARGPNHFFGGPMPIDYEERPPEWLMQFLPASVRGFDLDPPDQAIDKPIFLGANYAAFTADIQRVGGFLKQLGTGTAGNPLGEETEIQQRLLASGVEAVFVPDARIWHYVPRSRCTPAWAMDRMRRLRVTQILLDKNPPPPGPLWWGVPRWMWRRFASRWIKATLANLHPDPVRRFEIQKLYHEFRGTVEGTRLRLAAEKSAPR